MSELEHIQEAADELKNMPADAMGMREGIIVSRAVCAYKRTGDNALGQTILEKAKELVKQETILTQELETAEYPSPWCLLYQAYKICPEEEIYKNKIMELKKSGVYMGICFDMNYETLFGGKEKYHALTVRFGELARRPRKSDMEEAAFMLALIDTIEAIDQAVYELYRNLTDLFRNEMKALAAGARARAGLGNKAALEHFYNGKCRLLEDGQAQGVLACAVKKACRSKVILAEKYEAYICG